MSPSFLMLVQVFTLNRGNGKWSTDPMRCPRMKKRTRPRTVFTVIIAGCLAVLILACQSPGPRLKDLASRFPFVPDSIWVRWLNDHEVIYAAHEGSALAYFRLNLQTYTRERLPALASLNPTTPIVSPDGKWLLWIGYDLKQHRTVTRAATLD